MILALGGNGFIGHNFVKRFSKKEKIRILTRTGGKKIENDNIEFVKGDFKCVDFDVLLEGVDTVFHFISSSVPFDGTDRVMDDIQTNILPTVRLLEAMKVKEVRRIFFISSGGTVYGECNNAVKESTALSPGCIYAVQKTVIESYLKLYEKYDGIQGYILRVANPYGLEINKEKKQGVIPIFTRKILKGEPIEIWGDGENRRDYIYIDEVIDAIEAIYNYTGTCRVFNIGTGISYSIKDIIKLIERETQNKAQIKYRKKRKCDIISSNLDISLIYRECGWMSKITITQGIKDCVDKINKVII